MKVCQHCGSKRVLNATTETNSFVYQMGNGPKIVGDVPNPICGDRKNLVSISVCLDCGKTQGTFPAEKLEYEQEFDI